MITADPTLLVALAVVVKATALLGIAAIMQLVVFRRASAATRHLVWTIALVSALLLPIVSLVGPAWTVHTARNGSSLPGTPVRAAGEPDSGDAAADEAAAGIAGSLALFSEVYGRESYDGRGAPVILTVHYQRHYDNAFWDGTQLVFGDGDGRVFDRLRAPARDAGRRR